MYRPVRNIRLRSSARSDRGRVRQNNEDSVHLWAADHNVLAVVADGMGGAVAGEEASRIAVETVQLKLADAYHRKPDAYADYDSGELADLLGDIVREANINIVSRQIDRPELKGMGTTITMAFARQDGVVIAHVGDSRAYYVDGIDGTIKQLTADHTFVRALLDHGHITAEEAANHPMSNVLYRALGQAEDLEVDVYKDMPFYIGDRLVLCSDGLTLHVKPDEIAMICMSGDDPHVISESLINLANSRGGKDNVSVIVIVAEEDGKRATSEMVALSGDNYDDDGATVPFNPNLMAMNRKPHEKSPKALYGTSSPNYGEGRDNFEPMQ